MKRRLVLVSILFAVLAPANVVGSDRAGCVLGPLQPSVLMDRVKEWNLHASSRMEFLGLTGDSKKVEIRLTIDECKALLVYTLDSSCSTTSTIELEDPECEFLREQLDEFAHQIDIMTIPLESNSTSRTNINVSLELQKEVTVEQIGIILFFLCVIFWPENIGIRSRKWFLYTGVCVLTLWIIWPIMNAQLSPFGAIERVCHMHDRPFSDWHHPFLVFLLSWPLAQLSIEPFVLRLGPLFFLLAQVVLLAIISKRLGGFIAAALATAWFICEIRLRPGVADLSDWDAAGFFLLTWILWWMHADQSSEKPKPIPIALLTFCGVSSSYVMPLPAVILSFLLFLERRRFGNKPFIYTGVVALTGVIVAGIFTYQTITLPGSHLGAVLRNPLLEGLKATPYGRSNVMLLFMASGFIWLILKIRHRWSQLALWTIAGMFLVWFISNKAGPKLYYLSVLTPLFLLSGAVGTVALLTWFVGKLRSSRKIFENVVLKFLFSVIAITTITVPSEMPFVGASWEEYLEDFYREVSAHPYPVLVEKPSVWPLAIGYMKARRGEMEVLKLCEIATAIPDELKGRFFEFDFDSFSEVTPRFSNTPFYVVTNAYIHESLPESLQASNTLCRRMYLEYEMLMHYWICNENVLHAK